MSALTATCGYAQAGTFGHQCGRPAVFAGAKASESTKTGVFWAARCAECKELTGGDNRGVTHWEPFDAARHVNEWPDAAIAKLKGEPS